MTPSSGNDRTHRNARRRHVEAEGRSRPLASVLVGGAAVFALTAAVLLPVPEGRADAGEAGAATGDRIAAEASPSEPASPERAWFDSAPASPGPPSTTAAEPALDPVAPSAPVAVRGSPGAPALGSRAYLVPAGALYVSPDGSDGWAGSRSLPMKTITAALSRISTGGTIVLRTGSYHENVIVPPQKRVTIQPAPYEEVWLDGAETVTGWRASGSTWIKDGWTLDLDDSPTYRRGAPDNTKPGWRFVPADRPMAAHPDQVWVGGSPLQQVSSRELVTRGTFFVDKTSRQLVIGSNPDGALVQASALTQALSIRSSGTTIRGIGIRRYATSMPDMGTVVAAADDVCLVDVMIRDNSTTGFYSWGRNTTLTRVSLIANGVLGGGASTADGLRVSQLLSAGNNVEGFNRAPVSGAFKVTRSRGVTITDSAFLENAGQGPWVDESVYDITFTGNDVIGNLGNGLVVELSEKAIIADNVIANNAIAGIFVVNSGSVDIWNNTVVGNQRNISVVMDTRRASDTSAPGHDPRRPIPDPTVSWITRNVVVSDNVLGAAEGDCVICVEDSSRSTRGVQMLTSSNGNLYHRSTASAPRWFGIWANGAGGSRTYDTLEQFRSATGNDGRSVLAVGASVVSEAFALVPEWADEQASIAVPIPVNVAAVSRLQGGSRVLGAVLK